MNDLNNIEMSIELPSEGKFYNDFDGKMVIRSLNTGDEQKIFGSSSPTTLDRVLNGIIIEPAGFDINTLIPGDKKFLMYKARIHTYGSMYKQGMYCPLCNYEGTVDLNMDDIEVFKMPDKIKVPLRIKLPVNNDIIELKVLNCKQINAIEDRANKTSKNTGVDVNEVLYTLKLAKRIATVNGDTLDSFESEKYIRQLNPRDRAYIDSAFKSIKIGYSSIVDVTCPKCGKTITIPFELTGEFFNPSSEVEFL